MSLFTWAGIQGAAHAPHGIAPFKLTKQTHIATAALFGRRKILGNQPSPLRLSRHILPQSMWRTTVHQFMLKRKPTLTFLPPSIPHLLKLIRWRNPEQFVSQWIRHKGHRDGQGTNPRFTAPSDVIISPDGLFALVADASSETKLKSSSNLPSILLPLSFPCVCDWDNF
jgi:hypothetical protein